MGTRQRNWFGGVALLAITGASVAAVAGTSQAQEAPITIQVLGTNDFHGRISRAAPDGGAAVLAGAVTQLRAQYPDTVFAAAGDLIGASTFESFIQQDNPTIDALNLAGLEVSAVGNHEFDHGYADLTDRVVPRANWEYLGANVRNAADGSPALPETWIQDFGDVQVGFVGAVTDHLDELVSPDGIQGLEIEPPVVAANRSAVELKAEGADIIVLLVHEGAATTALASATDPTSDFGKIVNGASPLIDAIISGHTHLAYNHAIPVQAWTDEGRDVTARPVVSAGQYGANLDQILFDVDPETLTLDSVTSAILPMFNTPPVTTPPTPPTLLYPEDPAVVALVADAVAKANVLGAQPLGAIAGPFNRAKKPAPPPTTQVPNPAIPEHRGGESTLGNLVAEVQQTATEVDTAGNPQAQIAFMNPGGLRADMTGSTYPATLTYRQAANVQPFANTLVNMDLTGAQIKTVLEKQWQPAGAARPFLRLGIAEGFTHTYDPAAPTGSHVTQMWLDHQHVAPTSTYSVTVNSFLAAGGDNFFELANGTNKTDTGQVDLEAMVDYAAANPNLAPDYSQRSVGVSFQAGSPATYAAGSTVSFALSSLLMAAEPAAPAGTGRSDATVAVDVDGIAVGEFPVDNGVLTTDVLDENGRAAVSFAVPAGLTPGAHVITVTGTSTGTTTTIPLQTTAAMSTTTLAASAPSQMYGSADVVTLTAKVAVAGATPAGTVDFVAGGKVLATVPLANGAASYTLPATQPAGSLTVTAVYGGVTDMIVGSTSDPVTVTIAKATSRTVLATTRTTQKYGAIVPTLLISGTGLDNGQIPQGFIEFRDGDTVVARTGSFVGLSLYVVPRSVAVGTHTFTATFVPFDAANYAPSTSNPVTIRVSR